MIATTRALEMYMGVIQTYFLIVGGRVANAQNRSEQFSTAGRSIKTGLVGKPQ